MVTALRGLACLSQGHALQHSDNIVPDAAVEHPTDVALADMVRETTSMNAYGRLGTTGQV